MVGIVSAPTLPLLTRLWFSLLCLVRVLFDGAFAARLWAARSPEALPPAPERSPRSERGAEKPAKDHAEARAAARARRRAAEAARIAPLQLLGLLQRQGRLIDFLQQDITDFDDADVGAAARVVHEGCRKALGAHAVIEPIRDEPEESEVAIDEGFDPAAIKLSGQVAGKPPFRGTLRHRGWRVRKLELPTPLEGHDFEVVAPAEVEIGPS